MNNNELNIQKTTISLDIQSNVNYPVTINVLGNPFNPLDTSNATTQYKWDFTSFVFGTENSLQLQYKEESALNYSIYTNGFTPSIAGVVAALNQLGIGYFYSYTESGNTYITTYNDNYIFGLLNLSNPSLFSPPPSASYYFKFSTSGLFEAYRNATLVASAGSGEGGGNLGITSTSDTIRITGVSSTDNPPVKFHYAYVTNLTTGETPYFVSLDGSDTYDSGNIIVGNYVWEAGYIDVVS